MAQLLRGELDMQEENRATTPESDAALELELELGDPNSEGYDDRLAAAMATSLSTLQMPGAMT